MKKFGYFALFSLLFCSSLYSQSWTLTTGNVQRVYAFAVDPVNSNTMYTAGLDSGVFKTTDAGVNWTKMATGMAYNHVQCLSISPSNPLVLYAGTDHLGTTNSGVYKTTDGGANWTLFITGIQEANKAIQSVTVHPTNPNIAWITVFDGVSGSNSVVGLYKTTDGGANWNPSITGIGPVHNFLAVCVNPLNGNTLYAGTSFMTAGTDSSFVYKSINGGANWTVSKVFAPVTSTNPVRAITMSPTDTSLIMAVLFCNDTSGGAYVSTNAGLTWTKKWPNAQSTAGTLFRSCAIRPMTNELFVGLDRATITTDLSIWRSTNLGDTWTQFVSGALTNNQTIRSLVFKDVSGTHTLYAGSASATGKGVYSYAFPPVPVELTSFIAEQKSNSVLLKWSTATETNNKGFEIQKSSDGELWNSISFIPGAGTSVNRNDYSFMDRINVVGHYYYRLKQLDFDGSVNYSAKIRINVVYLPGAYALEQNYPNPFNPSTVIRYSIPENMNVNIGVYDILGNLITTLVNEVQDKGGHEIIFNAGNISAGVYFYRIKAGEFTQTNKLIYIK